MSIFIIILNYAVDNKMKELYIINYDHDIEEFYISYISVNKDKNWYKQKHTQF